MHDTYLLILLLFLLGRQLRKSLRFRRFKSDQDEIWQKYSSRKYASIDESDFRFDVVISRWRLWRHFKQESAATWRV